MKPGPKSQPLSLQAIYDKCVRVGSCLLWQGKLSGTKPFQYGQVKRRIDGHEKYYRVHRVVYELLHGHTDLFVCHRCDITTCVEDIHLIAGTNKYNMQDMSRKGRGKPHGRHSYVCHC